MAQVARLAHATRCDRGTIQLVVGVLLLGGLAFGGCDAQSTAARTPTGTPTATPNLKGAGTPETPVPTPTLPYTFPTAWRAPSGSPAGVSGFAFAPSAPQIGYACAGNNFNPGATPTPSATGGPALDVTHDGGATWQALRTGPFAQGNGCYRPFVDDSNAQDVFVAIGAPWAPNSNQGAFELWRSRDGGQTWSKLNSPDANDPIYLEKLMVAGGRLVVTIRPSGGGWIPYLLVGSDDGGATWTPLGQNLLTQKDSFRPVYRFDGVVGAGASLYASIEQNCYGGCVEVTPAPGQARPGEYRSTDRGTTWQLLSLPFGIDTFTRTPSGAYYGLAVQPPANSNGATTLYWSRDGGANWTALPTMANVEGGYLDPASVGAAGQTIAPDGTVIAATLHQYASNQRQLAGLFYLHATDLAPVWRPLAPPGEENLGLQAVATSSGVRLWAIAYDAPLGPHLVYVDIP